MNLPMKAVIVGMGVALPDEVRENSFWPEDISSAWLPRFRKITARMGELPGARTANGRRIMSAIESYHTDAFAGCRTRHIAPPGAMSSDLEAAAARQAIEAAGVNTADIAVVLSSSIVPDYLALNQAAVIQEKVGLPTTTLALSVDTVCTSFIPQLITAQHLLAGGIGRYALLTQGSTVARLMDPQHPATAWHGDGAAAVVVGLSDSGNGLLAHNTFTDGSLCGAFVLGQPGGRWYDEGKVTAHSPDPAATQTMMLGVGDSAEKLFTPILAGLDLQPAAVDFYASHQPTAWFRAATQACCGFDNARSCDNFPRTGSVVAANFVMQLVEGVAQGHLQDGDTLALFGMAGGYTATAAMMRWGK